MRTLDIETLRAEIAREVQNTDDLVALQKISKIFRRRKAFEPIPGMPYTDEERRESVRRSMENARKGGKTYTTDEVKTIFGLR